MYMVAFLYPNADGVEFDLGHFVDVHLPLGVGLTAKHLGLKPEKIVIYAPVAGVDGDRNSSPHSAISSVFFHSRDEAERFVGLFEIEEAARRLGEDFPNYTPGPPEVIVAQVTELTDMDALIEQFASMDGG